MLLQAWTGVISGCLEKITAVKIQIINIFGGIFKNN
jgi:hypothetical protein